jgi:hypothetical protein
MYGDEKERRTRQVAAHELDSKVEKAVRACEGRARQAERAAKDAACRAEEVKWRIDGRGIRPRRSAKRVWAAHFHKSVR